MATMMGGGFCGRFLLGGAALACAVSCQTAGPRGGVNVKVHPDVEYLRTPGIVAAEVRQVVTVGRFHPPTEEGVIPWDVLLDSKTVGVLVEHRGMEIAFLTPAELTRGLTVKTDQIQNTRLAYSVAPRGAVGPLEFVTDDEGFAVVVFRVFHEFPIPRPVGGAQVSALLRDGTRRPVGQTIKEGVLVVGRATWEKVGVEYFVFAAPETTSVAVKASELFAFRGSVYRDVHLSGIGFY